MTALLDFAKSEAQSIVKYLRTHIGTDDCYPWEVSTEDMQKNGDYILVSYEPDNGIEETEHIFFELRSEVQTWESGELRSEVQKWESGQLDGTSPSVEDVTAMLMYLLGYAARMYGK